MNRTITFNINFEDDSTKAVMSNLEALRGLLGPNVNTNIIAYDAGDHSTAKLTISYSKDEIPSLEF